jgi:hypothetical protein
MAWLAGSRQPSRPPSQPLHQQPTATAPAHCCALRTHDCAPAHPPHAASTRAHAGAGATPPAAPATRQLRGRGPAAHTAMSSPLYVALVVAATMLSVATSAVTKKPHIFIILADDYGWHNIGWRNPEIESPNLDGLAAEGIKLDRHYVFKYCSPTRSSLLSGRLPLHVNQNNEANDIESRSGIDLRMTLLPAKMKQAGYATAMSGKGHLGARTPSNLMINRGFDRHFGFLKGGEDHLTQCLSDRGFPSGRGPDLWRDHGPAIGENGTFSTLLYGREAVKIVEEHALPQPLFVYLPFQVTHSPYELPPGYPVDKVDPARRTFNGMVHIMVIIAIALHLFEAYVTGATDRRTRPSVIYPWRWPRRK